jgi:hypothetical protein
MAISHAKEYTIALMLHHTKQASNFLLRHYWNDAGLVT